MKYTDALAYLDSLSEFRIKLGLSHTKSMCDRLGNPEKSFRSIHIAGTNGKGSTLSFLSYIFQEAGFRVAAYTSPHLVDIRERICINRKLIPEDHFANMIRKVKESSVDEPPTYFEALTIAAFYYFSLEKPDIALVEVGMGGRLDSTNILVPEVSVITPLGLDHTEYLGKDISEIAYEKAGIIKEGVPVIAFRGAGFEVIRKIANAKGSRLIEVTENDYVAQNGSIFIPVFNMSLQLGLSGRHQAINAMLALRAIDELKEIDISKNDKMNGLSKTRWEGRLEKIAENPLTILDGAHNPHGALALSGYMSSLPKPRILVFSAMKNKDIKGIAEILSKVVDGVILTEIGSERGATIEQLVSAWKGRVKSIFAADCPAGAVISARKQASSNGSVIVAGSLYLIGKVKSSITKGIIPL